MLWEVLWLVAIAAILLFSFVILFGAPFLPTLSKRTADAFELLDLKPGQTMLELGSGDGRMLRAAAEQGIKSIGYELNPLLVIWSKLLCFKQRKLITIKWANYWRHSLPSCDGIYVFLLKPFMPKLDAKIKQDLGKGIKLVSFAFEIPDKKPAAEKTGMFLYKY